MYVVCLWVQTLCFKGLHTDYFIAMRPVSSNFPPFVRNSLRSMSGLLGKCCLTPVLADTSVSALQLPVTSVSLHPIGVLVKVLSPDGSPVRILFMISVQKLFPQVIKLQTPQQGATTNNDHKQRNMLCSHAFLCYAEHRTHCFVLFTRTAIDTMVTSVFVFVWFDVVLFTLRLWGAVFLFCLIAMRRTAVFFLLHRLHKGLCFTHHTQNAGDLRSVLRLNASRVDAEAAAALLSFSMTAALLEASSLFEGSWTFTCCIQTESDVVSRPKTNKRPNTECQYLTCVLLVQLFPSHFRHKALQLQCEQSLSLCPRVFISKKPVICGEPDGKGGASSLGGLGWKSSELLCSLWC